MGYQIIKQPNDLFAIFSSYTDTVIVWDSTQAEVLDWFIELEADRVRRDIGGILANVAAGEARKSYFQFAMTWDEALEKDREHDGEAWRSGV